MNRTWLPGLLLVAFLAVPASMAQAFDPWFYGFNQRPFGLQSETMVPTPPYFSIHPPVYYGDRYARPYGISPFPAAPNVHIPESYKAVPMSAAIAPVVQNPYCEISPVQVPLPESVPAVHGLQAGKIQVNPFANPKSQMVTTGRSL